MVAVPAANLRMAHFMVLRYVSRVPELPKTPTQKVQKHLIRTVE
jgi:carnitine-CoA ligase